MKISSFFSSLRSFLWIIPFLSFITGYFILDRLFRSEELETPALIGLNMQQAITLLASKNLNLRFLATKEDAMLEPGTIISQSPNAEQKIKENQSVYVVVVTKPKQLNAPNCIGKQFNEIKTALESLKIRAKYYHLNSSYPQGMCFAQNPASAQELDKAHKMVIYISNGSHKPIIVPQLKGKSISAVTDFLSTQSAKTEIFHYPPMDEHECNCIITDQRPMAGSIINAQSDKPLHVQLQVRMP
jgi:serine/threonine-protein kinase